MATLVQAEIWTVARTEQGNAVLIRPLGSETAVPIFIGQLETQSILIGFGDVSLPRPLTHDLMLAMLRQLETEIVRIEIHDLRDNTFFARVYLNRGGREYCLDARPSDALALAVRTKCPVYIAEQIVDAVGVSIDQLMDAAQSQPAEESGKPLWMSERETMQAELNLALSREDYEQAAILRDRLAALDREHGA